MRKLSTSYVNNGVGEINSDRFDTSTRRWSASVEKKLRSKYLDKKTLQFIHHQCLIIPKKQVKLSKNEEASSERMSDLMAKHSRVKRSACQVLCLEDRFRFKRLKSFGTTSPFWEILRYCDVKFWMCNPTHQGGITLYVENLKTQRRTYEVYQCVTLADADKIDNLLHRARREPDFRLRQPSLPISDEHPSSELIRSGERLLSKSLPVLTVSEGQQTSFEDIREQANQVLKSNRIEKVECYRSNVSFGRHSLQDLTIPLPRCEIPTPISDAGCSHSLMLYEGISDFETVCPETNHLVSSEEAKNIGDKDWKSHITFVETDGSAGLRISDNGPVYLYSLRIESPQINKKGITVI